MIKIVSTGGAASSGGGSTSSSSSVGGGANTYSNFQNDFVATPTVGTKDIVVSQLSAFTLTVQNIILGVVKKIDSVGVVTTLDSSKFTLSGTNPYTINLPLITNFAVGDIVDLIIVGPDKYADNISNSELSTTLNTPQIISPMPLIDTTNVAAATSYYPSSDGVIVNMKDMTIDVTIIAGAGADCNFYIEKSDEDETVTTPVRFRRCPIPEITAADTTNTSSLPSLGQRDLLDVQVNPAESWKATFDLNPYFGYRVRFVVIGTGASLNTIYIAMGGKMLGA